MLAFEFAILEKDDGFSLQLIYVGSPTALIKLSGLIEGVPHQIGTASIETGAFWSAFTEGAIIIPILLVGVLILVVVALAFVKIRRISQDLPIRQN